MDAILENELIERLARGLPRSPLQLNGLRESDAELIRLPGGGMLALTTDGIVEELETGLYADPELMGWMVVLVNASDLAAVGAEPLGILLNHTLPQDLSAEFVDHLQCGIARASAACGLPVLGGDVNTGTRLNLAATAIGLIADGRAMTRVGCAPGDVLFASAPLGIGGAFALSRLARTRTSVAIDYRPQPRLVEGRALRRFASACIDTSDGAIPALDELMRLNDVGFRLEPPLEDIIDAPALAACSAAGLPPWTLLAGPHGEFELVFTVPERQVGDFITAAGRIGWAPVRLGRVVRSRGLWLTHGGVPAVIDTARVRNLFVELGGDVEAYASGLLDLLESRS